MCKQLYFSKVTTVHVLEKVLGTMESVRPSTPLAALQYGKGGVLVLQEATFIRDHGRLMTSETIPILHFWKRGPLKREFLL